MEVTINKSNLKRFLNLISLTGENQIREALFTIKKDTITSFIKSPAGTVGLSATLKGKFQEVGEIGIDDLVLFENALNIQDKEETILKITENKISISSGKTRASLLLRKPDYIKNKPKEEDFKKYITSASGNEFVLTNEDIDKVMKAYNLIKSEVVTVSSETGKSVKFLFSRLDNEIETEIDLQAEIKPFKTTVNSFLLYLLNLLEIVTISIKKDTQIILLTYKEDKIEATYIVAPYGK